MLAFTFRLKTEYPGKLLPLSNNLLYNIIAQPRDQNKPALNKNNKMRKECPMTSEGTGSIAVYNITKFMQN